MKKRRRQVDSVHRERYISIHVLEARLAAVPPEMWDEARDRNDEKAAYRAIAAWLLGVV